MKLLKTVPLGKGLNRRQLLKALGVGAAVAPLVPSLDAWSQAATKKRLLLTFSSSGTIPETWYPTGTETAWTFPKGGSLEPLAKHQADMIIMKGLQRGASGGGGHEQSMGGLWTGNSCQSSVAQAASVDQIIAKNLKANMAKEVDYPSVQLGALCFYAGDGDITSKIKNNNPYMIHAGPGQKIASECDPYKVASSGPTTDTGAMDRLRAEKRSVIDAVKDDLADVQTVVAREDKMKIQAHLELVRDIERRLDAGGPKMIGAVPARPMAGIALDKSANYPMIIDIMNKLTVATFATDRTRVASLQYSRGFSQIKHTWVGANSAHHTLSHMTSQKTVLGAIQRWYAERFVSLIDLFKATPDQGKTLFDSTLMVYSNELCLGWEHSVAPAATWWASGSNFGGKLKGTGRFIDYTSTGDYNQMLVSMCQAMDVTNVPRVGNFAKKDGGLPNLLVGV
jgi:uncharacterized protein DUF1552